MKSRLYWTYATRSLARGGQRSLLAVFCVGVGVLAIVALQLVSSAIYATFASSVHQMNGGDLAINSYAVPLSPGQVTYFDQLKRRGVVTAYTAIEDEEAQVWAAATAHRIEMLVVNPVQFPVPGGAVISAPSGASLRALLRGHNIVITPSAAQLFGWTIGQTVRFTAPDGRTGSGTIAGILRSQGYFGGAMMLVALGAYARLPSATGVPFAYTNVYLDVPGHTDARATAVAIAVHRQFPLVSTQTVKGLEAAARGDIQASQYFLQIVGLLALLIGGVGIMNTMQVALRRRRTEIAMLKAAGYRRRDLYALFGLEAGLIGLLGGVVGTGIGLGAGVLVQGLVAHAVQTAMTITVDGATIVSGVMIGLCMALIFGLLPIAQASQVRPQPVLRDLPARADGTRMAQTTGLVVLLAVLFWALASGVLGNPLVAAGVVGGTAVLLGLLGLAFGAVVVAISVVPVPESFHRWHVAPLALALALGAALTRVLPPVGVLWLAIVALGGAVPVLPRNWKWNVKLGLRTIGRQQTRSVATLLALTIGLFAIGLVLALGQNIAHGLRQRLPTAAPNTLIVVNSADRPMVDRVIARAPRSQTEAASTLTPDRPIAINGRPIAAILRARGIENPDETIRLLNGVQGYDLAGGQAPDPVILMVQRGSRDTHSSRTLTSRDAGTTNAMLPVNATAAPLHLKTGDRITIAASGAPAQVTVTVVGFYLDASRLAAEPIQVDRRLVAALSAGAPPVAILAHLDPTTAAATLAHLQDAVPSAQVRSLADQQAAVTANVTNAITVLIAVASLALLAGLIIIANAVALALLERRRDVGILKAVGQTSRGVLGEVLVETGVVGFTGAVLALLLVAVATPLLGALLFGASFGVPLLDVLLIVPATTLVCMLVAAGVAWRATHVRPLEVLRYE